MKFAKNFILMLYILDYWLLNPEANQVADTLWKFGLSIDTDCRIFYFIYNFVMTGMTSVLCSLVRDGCKGTRQGPQPPTLPQDFNIHMRLPTKYIKKSELPSSK